MLGGGGNLVDVPLVSRAETFTRAGLRRPAKVPQARYVHHLAWHAVGLGRVVFIRTAPAGHLRDQVGQLADRHVFASTDVDVHLGRVVLHQEHHGIGQVVYVHELTLRLAAAPDYNRG